MSKYRTAMGRTIDMGTLRARNQNVRAVGNMNVDAAGNTLDSNNEVISDSTKRVNQVYGKTTVNPGAAPRGRALPPDARNQPQSRSLPQQSQGPQAHHLSPLQRKLQAEQAAKEVNDIPVSPDPEIVPPPVVQPASVSVEQKTVVRTTLEPDNITSDKSSQQVESLFTSDNAPSQAELEQLTEWDEELPVEKKDQSQPSTSSRTRRR